VTVLFVVTVAGANQPYWLLWKLFISRVPDPMTSKGSPYSLAQVHLGSGLHPTLSVTREPFDEQLRVLAWWTPML